jgi:3-methyladenine DNA glycosylase Mpg
MESLEGSANAMARKTLPLEFFNRGADEVAAALLGKALARRRGNRLSCYRITETEAYVARFGGANSRS